MCDKTTIQELLPAYREGSLGKDARKDIEAHLETCADCRMELSLLEMMSEETVPDPGRTFWASMPDRVFRAVQEERAKNKGFSLSRFGDWLVLPRWAWASAALAAILLVSWFLVRPIQQGQPGHEADEHAYNVASPAQDPVFPNSSVSIGELSQTELENVENWAADQLSGLGSDEEPVLANTADTDVSEELTDLDSSEIERLSTMLQQVGQEG